MKINKILVIGGNGYIGKALVSSLEGQFKVHAPNRQQLDMGVVETYGYLETVDFDTILILASTVKGLNPQDADSAVIQNNVFFLSHFLSAIHKKNYKILYFSSMTVYGSSSRNPDENSKTNPEHLYGLSKVMAESLLFLHGKTFENRAAILRIPGIFGGSRKTGLLHMLKEKAAKDEPIELKVKGLTHWEVLSLNDLCVGVLRFLETYNWTERTEVFNLGYGHETDLVEVSKKVISLSGSKSLLSVDQKDYVPFSLNTKKIQKLTALNLNFDQSLNEYVLDQP
jgi:nucleoside-diphosphate-sugar epimerase